MSEFSPESGLGIQERANKFKDFWSKCKKPLLTSDNFQSYKRNVLEVQAFFLGLRPSIRLHHNDVVYNNANLFQEYGFTTTKQFVYDKNLVQQLIDNNLGLFEEEDNRTADECMNAFSQNAEGRYLEELVFTQCMPVEDAKCFKPYYRKELEMLGRIAQQHHESGDVLQKFKFGMTNLDKTMLTSVISKLGLPSTGQALKDLGIDSRKKIEIKGFYFEIVENESEKFIKWKESINSAFAESALDSFDLGLQVEGIF